MTPDRCREVAISLGTLVPGGMGGSEVYVRQLLKRARTGLGEALQILAPTGADVSTYGERVIPLPGFSGGSTGARLSRIVTTNLSVAGRRALRRCHTVHYPLLVPAPLPTRRARHIVTVHDVQHLDLPDLFTKAERAYRWLFYDKAAIHADEIITISEFTKQRLIATLDIPAERIHVVHLGQDLTPSNTSGERETFVLYPAKAWRHKNHQKLFQAMKLLRDRGERRNLVLTGCNPGDFDTVPENTIILGQVPRRQLLDLYARASCVAFPSRYEGFGLPILEAMAMGCPVASSTAGALQEVGGEAVEYFNPEDPDNMAEAISRAAGTQNLTEYGKSRAEAFTWDKNFAGHLRIYLGDRPTGAQ